MENITKEQLQENVAMLRERISRAALNAGRQPSDVLFCAASKLHDADTVRLAAGLDIDLFGENHVQEMLVKKAAGAYLDKPLHFIGHLQTNKVKQVVGAVELIQSVGSAHLMEAIEKQAAKMNLVQNILLEINIGGEESKSGIAPDELPSLLDSAAGCSHICIQGLMAVPPINTDDAVNRGYFAGMRRLFEQCAAMDHPRMDAKWLSMGMSGDFENAILEGANIVRIGTAVFGARCYTK